MPMRIHKPEQALFWATPHERGGQPRLVMTLGWLVDAGGEGVPESQAWPWLREHFPDVPFDAGLKKTRGSFAVAGQACAPAGTTVTHLAVRLRCGPLEKTLHVHGPRFWQRRLGVWRASPAQPFSQMPLDLAHAYGGSNWPENPAGRGHYDPVSLAEGGELPCIELPTSPCLSPADRPSCASLRPLPLTSAARCTWLGSLDQQWLAKRFPFLPDDADSRWYDEVPQDQCHTAYWRGDEHWSAVGMHPRQPQVEGRLPGLRPRLFLRWQDPQRADNEALLDLDTLWLFPAQQRVLMLYRCEVAVADCDAEDLQAVGVLCERLADSPQPEEACLSQCWPNPQARALQAAPQQRPEPGPTEPSMGARMQDVIDAFYLDFSRQRQDVVDQAAQAMKKQNLSFDPAKFAVSPAPRLSDVQRNLPVAPVDFQRFEACIGEQLAESRAQAQSLVRQALQRMGLDYDKEMLMARANELKARADPPDALGNLDRMPLSEQQKARAQAGIRQAEARQEDIERQVQQMRKALNEQLEASRPTRQALARVSAPVPDAEELQARHLAGESLREIRLERLDLSGINLAGADLTDAVIRDCRFTGAQLTGGCLDRAYVERCDFERVRLEQGSLMGTVIKDCHFSGAQLDGVQAQRASVHGGDFSAISATDADFSAANWSACRLERADFSLAQLGDASFSGVQAPGSVFRGALLQGLRLTSACDFTGADFQRADLRDASFADSCLRGASLREVTAQRALILRCDLSATDGWRLQAQVIDLTGSDLCKARWVEANLLQASLRKTHLDGLDLTGSNLFGVTTQGARGQGLVLVDTRLERCRLLEDLNA